MAYEQNLGQLDPELLDSPVGAGIDVTGQVDDSFDVDKAIEQAKTGIEAAKRIHEGAKAIHWTQLKKTFREVPERWMKLKQDADLQHKPRGSCQNHTVAKLKKGQLVMVVAQGTTADSCGWLFGLFPGGPVANSFVKTALDINIEGYVRTDELTAANITPVEAAAVETTAVVQTRDDEPAFGPAHGPPGEGVGIGPAHGPPGEGVGIGPAFGPAEPQSKLPILPLLGIGYFLLK